MSSWGECTRGGENGDAHGDGEAQEQEEVDDREEDGFEVVEAEDGHEGDDEDQATEAMMEVMKKGMDQAIK